MARPLSSFKGLVGRVVYHYGHPQVLGLVKVEYPKPTEPLARHRVDVHWHGSEKVTLEDVISLQDFESLVLETEGKAKRHREAYEAALKEL